MAAPFSGLAQSNAFALQPTEHQTVSPQPTSQTFIPPPEESTLDESIWKTLWRDVMTIGRNLRTVLIPINWKFSAKEQSLRNWDLWGPLVFILLLSFTLSWGSPQASTVFAMVFAETAVGAVIMTWTVTLLGGDIVFFQALCLLGYCLFPICVAALACSAISIGWVRLIVIVGGITWASAATIPFIGNAVPVGRKFLAIYPVILLYLSLGWLSFVKS